MLKKLYSVKTKSSVSFSSLLYRWSILETGHFVCLEVVSLSSVCPCKENTAKGKEAFQGKFVVIVEGFSR